MSDMDNSKHYEILAQKLKAIAHPYRLCIVKGLMEHECNVSYMQECLGLPQSTVSQHLAKLKSAGIIEGRRDGLEVCYKVVDDDVKNIINVLFKP
ncbi:transcriptional regulator, ArsR family [Mahella australiensis 50-1 BON]|uniref:Transcriptional regulator, ArsR family n=2 Tax=Mahella TaxID=252965 RepID=F3ZVA9_MAHA5|nr:transcriptional regulator, ArsR family [Mahella australiensis 50-1 BON]